MTELDEPRAAAPPRSPVANMDLLKALADPLRMSMMYALTRNTSQGLPVMSVKELAAELGEPKTKLYRHVKHLEAAGLISAVSSRVVSGIVEQRYQAARTMLSFTGNELTAREQTSPEAEAMVAAALETFRRQYFTALRSRRHQPDEPRNDEASFVITDGRVSAARAAAIREQLRALADELCAEPAPDADDLVPVNLLIGYFSPEPPPAG